MAKVDTANRKVSIPSQDVGIRGLKLNYQASDLKAKEVAFFTQCIFKWQVLLLSSFMAIKIISRLKNI